MARLSGRSLLTQSAWALSGQVAQGLLALASVAVIARLLGPEVYGLFALTMLIVGLAEILVGGHVTDFLIQKATVEREDRNAAFVLTVLAATAIAAALLVAAPLVATMLGKPEIAVLVPAVSVLVILTACRECADQSPRPRHEVQDPCADRCHHRAGRFHPWHGARLRRGGDLEPSGDGDRAGAACASSSSPLAAHWLPGISFHWHNIVELWTFAKSRLLSASFQYLAQATPRLVIETMLGTQALGYFAVASRLLDQATGLMTGPLAAVAFPAAARSKGDLEQLRGLLARAIATSTAIAWPAILGFVVVAPIVIPMLLGPEWIGAVLTVQILTLSALRSSVTGFNGAIILGLGRADLRMRLHFFNALLGLLLCPIGALMGLEGVAAAMVVRAFISWPISASYVERLAGFAAQRQIQIAVISAVPAVAMATSIEILRRSLDGLVSAPLLGLILIACGIVLYIVFWAALNYRQMGTVAGLAFGLLSRQRKNVEVG